MKKAIAYFFSMLIILLIASLALVSCKTTQPIKDHKEITMVNYDSIFNSWVITRNKAIADSVKIVIGKIKTEKRECDSVCQTAIDRVLSQLNSKKASGDIGYNLFYNPKDNSLNFNTHVGETTTESKAQFRRITKTITITITKEIPVKLPLTKLEQILIAIGIASTAFLFLKVVSYFKTRFINA